MPTGCHLPLYLLPLCTCRGELYPVETDERLCDVLQTGQEVEVDMVADVLTDLSTGKKYSLKPLGDVSGRRGGSAADPPGSVAHHVCRAGMAHPDCPTVAARTT